MVTALPLSPLRPSAAAPVRLSVVSDAPRKASDYVELVKKVAYSMARRLPSRVDVRDLVSSGTLGLLDAIAKYDPTQNDNFEAYAEIRIRGAILDELRALDWVPRSVRQKSQALDSATRKLEGDLGRAPSDEELAHSMDLSIDAYHSMSNDARAVAVVSLEDVLGGALPGPTTEAEDSPLDQLCRRATAAALSRSLEQLAERDRLVLNLYYVESLKLKEIGEILGVTESRVCQLHGQAISRLKAKMAEAMS